MGSQTETQQQAFLEAYDTYADALFRHCFFRVYDRDVAEDLVQDAFMKTWNEVAKGTTIENIRAFLYRVTNNLIIDYVRKKKSVSLDAMVEEGFSPSDFGAREHVMEQAIGRDVNRILSILDEEYRVPVIMRLVDGMTPREIAEALDVSENVVSVRIHRAMQKLRDFYGPSELL
ncbi:MAG: RNA polymerase sigma factor [Patescibacteria group bacterium]